MSSYDEAILEEVSVISKSDLRKSLKDDESLDVKIDLTRD